MKFLMHFGSTKWLNNFSQNQATPYAMAMSISCFNRGLPPVKTIQDIKKETTKNVLETISNKLMSLKIENSARIYFL